MGIKKHLKHGFLYALIISFGPIILPIIIGSEGENGADWSKILFTYLGAVVLNTFIIAFLRKQGYAMMKSFTEPEDGPLS